MFNDPTDYLDENSEYKFFDLMIVKPLKNFGLESILQSVGELFGTITEYAGSMKDEISVLVKSEYSVIFAEFGKAIGNSISEIVTESWKIMKQAYPVLFDFKNA